MMIDRHKNFEKKLNIVMFAFAKEFPFWGVISERCSFRVTEKDHFCKTACIDKFGNITFNLDFYETLTDKQFLFLISHEICHFIFHHHQRLGNRILEYWNIATDFAINLMLKYQFDSNDYLVKNILIDEKYKDMMAEQIYEDLNKNSKNTKVFIKDLNQSESDDKDSVLIRDRRVPLPDKKNKSNEQYNQEIKDYIKQAICEAHATAKSQGKMPAGMERIIINHLKPKVNWLQAFKRKLRFTVSLRQPRDTNWLQPNRRFLDRSYIMPSVVGPDSPKIAFALDTSSSMSEKELDQAISEIEDIRKKFSAKIYFMDCDSIVYKSRWLSLYEKIPKIKGGGGTDFAPVFEHLIEKRISPDYCVFFTDGRGNFGKDPTNKFHVLWVLTDQFVKPPFGETIRINIENES